MTSPSWDPKQYAQFAVERARPFHDLLAQVPTSDPVDVVDLGCGPGTLTATLLDRWPGTVVHGIDSAPEMIAAAQPLARPGRLSFSLGDISAWRPAPDTVDVLIANASLQWVPGHAELLPGWLAALRPGGCLAIQMPAGGGSAATAVFREIATSPRWAARLTAGVEAVGPRSARSPVRDPIWYLDLLARLGASVNVWETTYLHVLRGEDAVLEWFAGTGLRPYLDALRDDRDALGAFRSEVAERLRAAYPRRGYGTVLPFRRIFVVATRH